MNKGKLSSKLLTRLNPANTFLEGHSLTEMPILECLGEKTLGTISLSSYWFSLLWLTAGSSHGSLRRPDGRYQNKKSFFPLNWNKENGSLAIHLFGCRFIRGRSLLIFCQRSNFHHQSGRFFWGLKRRGFLHAVRWCSSGGVRKGWQLKN